jgi:cytochrome c oxidase cbb3-type subunit III
MRATVSRIAVMVSLAIPLLAGCNLPGKPADGPEVPRPEEIVSYKTLYATNCAGCHGANGQLGAATSLANPVYQSLIDDATLRDLIANGEDGTLMPGFSAKSGGTLTEEQIEALVKGIRAEWSKGNVLAGQNAPPYKATHAGDATKGADVYAAACARCHGDSVQKPGRAGAILDGSFLALVNAQTIRTTILAGRPDLGMPDWRSARKDRALTDDEVTDLTAWLMTQRPSLPGQPYGNAAAPAVTAPAPAAAAAHVPAAKKPVTAPAAAPTKP